MATPRPEHGRGRPGRDAGWARGWWQGAGRRRSPNQGPRPRGTAVTLAVIHSISLPPGHYGGPQIAQLFGNRLDHDAHPYFAALRGLRVSAHFLVRRRGQVLQFVSCHRRAWHAGQSVWRGRAGCNDFSIGIELEGLEGETFEPAQYRALARLLAALARRFPGLQEAVGHEHVAPGRKADPGPGFTWPRLRRALGRLPLQLVGERAENSRAAGANRPLRRAVAGPAKRHPHGR